MYSGHQSINCLVLLTIIQASYKFIYFCSLYRRGSFLLTNLVVCSRQYSLLASSHEDIWSKHRIQLFRRNRIVQEFRYFLNRSSKIGKSIVTTGLPVLRYSTILDGKEYSTIVDEIGLGFTNTSAES